MSPFEALISLQPFGVTIDSLEETSSATRLVQTMLTGSGIKVRDHDGRVGNRLTVTVHPNHAGHFPDVKVHVRGMFSGGLYWYQIGYDGKWASYDSADDRWADLEHAILSVAARSPAFLDTI